MANYVNAHIVTSAATDMWVKPYGDFVVVALGDRHGSELNIHLHLTEIDRLSTALDEARQALCPPAVKVAA